MKKVLKKLKNIQKKYTTKYTKTKSKDYKTRSCFNCDYFQNEINNEEIACDYWCGFFPIKYKYCNKWKKMKIKTN